ncbi:DUF4124 domain-containing protein [Massilia sp. DWR3-1-1]|uniref:DUF4124 domain-containing protein n=1 Tax=Massilia sp. DWR3-1-1 TaxID=2804559 RepID=UPI003CF308FA
MPAPLRPLMTAVLGAALAALLAAPALAGADIVKCVDADGGVTITDHQCGTAATSGVKVANEKVASDKVASDKGAGTRAARTGSRPLPAGQPPVQRDNWRDPRPHSKLLARDAATLRAARSSLQVLDDAAAAMRQQRLARLN